MQGGKSIKALQTVSIFIIRHGGRAIRFLVLGRVPTNTVAWLQVLYLLWVPLICTADDWVSPGFSTSCGAGETDF